MEKFRELIAKGARLHKEAFLVRGISRRDFVTSTGKFTAVGLLLGCGKIDIAMADSLEFKPNVYVNISKQGGISLIVHRSEMGQHARTSCAMLIAEELRVDLTKINIVQAVGDEKYGDQNTDGSTTAVYNWNPLRKAGAVAREMLVAAAAIKLKVPEKELEADSGFVIHSNSSQRIAYVDLSTTFNHIRAN